MPRTPRKHFLIITLIIVHLITGYSSLQAASADQSLHPLQQAEQALLAGLQRGIAYSGFRHGQHPDRGHGVILPTDEQIREDLEILTSQGNFDLIRLYDSQQNSQDILRIIREDKIPLKVMLGIWLDAEVSNHEGCAWIAEPTPEAELVLNRAKNRVEVESGIRLANTYQDIVVAVNVGNESLVTWNDHLVPIESMIEHLKTVKSRIQQPVTTADNYEVFAQYGSQLADHLDFLAVHTYPQWEEKTIEEALPYSIENLLKIRSVLPDNPIVISEAGWTTIALEFGERASEESQDRHYQELMAFGKELNITIFWFEAFDEDWKGETSHPLGAEKHWGLFDIDRNPKAAMRQAAND